MFNNLKALSSSMIVNSQRSVTLSTSSPGTCSGSFMKGAGRRLDLHHKHCLELHTRTAPEGKPMP